MIHLTAGIFGNAEIAKKLGKEGTKNDIAIYNHGSSEGVFTYVAVNSEKVQTLMQVMNMIDVPVFAVNELNAQVGEQIVAAAEFGFSHGFFLLEGVVEDQVRPMIKGTSLEKFEFVSDTTELVEKLKKVHIERGNGLLVPIDNYFNVKSVGTVILGIVKGGTVNKYDKVMVEPIGKEVTVKGIQSQDRDIEQAGPGIRVGLNLKGIEADELKRGYIIGRAEKAKSLKLVFHKSRYTKEQLRENDPVLVCSGLQVSAAKVKSVDPLDLEFENTISYQKNTRFLIATTKQTLPRIIGHGTL
jgi:selenocysteine-specific translation elongation factor